MTTRIPGIIGRHLISALAAATCLALSVAAVGQDTALDPASRAELVEAIAANLESDYIYEDRGHALAAFVRARLAANGYGSANTAIELAEQLTRDLYEESQDAHLRVGYDPTPRQATARRGREPDPSFGFRTVSILEGNVGYLDLRSFAGSDAARPTADAALALLSGADALIIDLRRNGGGNPWMVRYLSAFLFDRPTHLVTTWMRGMAAPQERWSADDLDVPPRPDLPVFILTSRRTFSAAESFTFGLMNNDRVTVVGERTGGGGHFGGTVDLPHGFSMFVPVGRSYNPRTERGWEAEGIAPHVEVSADDALQHAHELALGTNLGAPDSALAGAWSGVLGDATDARRVTLRVGETEGRLQARLVDHRAERQWTLDGVYQDGATLRCVMESADLEIELTLSDDGLRLVGAYRQEDEMLPLSLERRRVER